MKTGPTIEVKDRTSEFMERIKAFKNDKVLVGIPSTNDARKDSSVINNATLLFINNFGSPANNIPARPVMEIGLKKAQDKIAAEFKKATTNSWTKGAAPLAEYYERAGIIASNSIKRVINDQIDIDPPAKSTLRSRESREFAGTKALIVTGQMRNAITYVVKVGI